MTHFTQITNYNHGTYGRTLEQWDKTKLILYDKTFNSKFGYKPKKNCQFWFEGGWYRIPRSFAQSRHKHNILDSYVHNPITDFNIDSLKEVIQLDELQTRLYTKINKSLEDNNSCIVKAPPGTGKSYIALYLILKLKLSTIIIVNTVSLCDQWSKLIKQLFNYECGIYNSNNKTIKNITIASIDSLTPKNSESRNKLQLMANQFSFSIFDECHSLCSKKRSVVLSLFQTQYSIALSATPERADGFHRLLFFHFGDLCEYEKTRNEFNPSVHFIFLYFKIPKNNNFNELLSFLINNDERNDVIVDQIEKHKHKNILLLSDRIKHLELLQDKLKHKHIDSIKIVGSDNKTETQKTLDMLSNEHNTKTSNIVSNEHISQNNSSQNDISQNDISQNENDTIVSNSTNIILSTYLFFGTGISISKLDTLILASPKKNKINLEQYCGRIFRKGSMNKNERLVIDIVDMKSYTFKHYVNRKHYYESKNYDIQEFNFGKPNKHTKKQTNLIHHYMYKNE